MEHFNTESFIFGFYLNLFYILDKIHFEKVTSLKIKKPLQKISTDYSSSRCWLSSLRKIL